MELRILSKEGTRIISALPGETVLSSLQRQQGQRPGAPCGGRGICKKCTIYQVLPQGEKAILACQTLAEDGMVLRLPGEEPLVVAVETGKKVEPDGSGRGYGVAWDIGTTTIAGSLINLETGEILLSLGAENPQRAYGADVISRIQAAGEGKGRAMTGALRHKMAEMLETMGTKSGVKLGELTKMTVAANTTMCYLLCGMDPGCLGRAPYLPEDYFGRSISGAELGLPVSCPVYLFPAISGFVGGDITAGMLGTGLDTRENSTLFLDLGTNGELVLGQGDTFYACAAAAGPALEGAGIRYGMTASPGAISAVRWNWGQVSCTVIGDGKPTGICGSGLVDGVAVMLESGALDDTGRMLHPDEDEIPEELEPYLYHVDGEPAFCLMEEISITQSDVRKLQLCKGAIAAGISLLRQQSVRPVQRLLLAGGFGSYIRPASAARIGLIPGDLLPVTEAVGNTALLGAQMALCSATVKERLSALGANVRYIELSGNAAFQDEFVEMMSFPKA